MKRTGFFSVNRNGKGTWRFVAAALSMAALSTFSAWAQAPFDGCPTPPDKPAQIEVLPLKAPLTGNTCDLKKNTLTSYSLPCGINGVDYSKPEAVYKIWLHEGNEVGFNLRVLSGDPALALIQLCIDKKNSCLRSSDVSGPSNEQLPKKSYMPGIYYLSIDTAAGAACGRYELTVTDDSVNPVPDLVVTLTGSPKIVRMNDTLTYNLSVTNAGLLDAPGVTVTVTFPPGVTVPTVSGCPSTGPKTIACTVGSLPKLSGSTFKKTIAVKVVTSTPGALSSIATAAAQDMGQKLGDQNPANNQATDTTAVRARIRPGHRRHAPRPRPGSRQPRPGG